MIILIAILSIIFGFVGYSLGLAKWVQTRKQMYIVKMAFGLLGMLIGVLTLYLVSLTPRAHETYLGNPWREHSGPSTSSSWDNPFAFW